MLRVLEKSSFWLADGFFKITPKIFDQLYSIHVSVSGIAPACIYAFLPNKTEKIYNRFLQALIDLAPNCRPEKMLLDFEQAALQSFQKTFPEAHLSGCFFHLSQSYMRSSHFTIKSNAVWIPCLNSYHTKVNPAINTRTIMKNLVFLSYTC